MEELKDFARGPRRPRNGGDKKLTARHKGEASGGAVITSDGKYILRPEERPQELTSHLLTLSSANVSSELRKSCSNIIALTESKRNTSEKEILLKRLKELIEIEVFSVQSEIETKKKQMKSLRSRHREELDTLLVKHQAERSLLSEKHNKAMEKNEKDFRSKILKVRNELEYLETELRHLSLPVEMLSSLLSSTDIERSQSPPALQDMSEELVCCSCQLVCLPPAEIYQCPQGRK